MRGHVITWTENGQDKWEYVDTAEMLLYIYNKAVEKCGVEGVYMFEAKVMTMSQVDILVKALKSTGVGR